MKQRKVPDAVKAYIRLAFTKAPRPAMLPRVDCEHTEIQCESVNMGCPGWRGRCTGCGCVVILGYDPSTWVCQ